MQHCLIISRSARALTASATKAHFNVHAIDAFADEDTTQMATTMYRCEYNNHQFDQSELLQRIDELLNEFSIEVCVLGAGMELHADLLSRYTNQFQLCANSKETLDKLNNPFRFSQLCKEYDIAFPEVRSELLHDNGWLMKQIGAHGGEHICWANQADQYGKHTYFQQYHAGEVRSVVFLSDGNKVVVIGFNRLMQYQYQDYPFLYAGAVSIQTTRTEQEKIIEILKVLNDEVQLKGLCGMDYLVKEDGTILVLEVNARPPATFELHEDDESLFKVHIEAFNQQIDNYHNDNQIRGCAIIYAKNSLLVREDINWPGWVKDRPSKGTEINAGQPVCSIYANADSAKEIENLLICRRQTLEKTLHSLNN